MASRRLVAHIFVDKLLECKSASERRELQRSFAAYIVDQGMQRQLDSLLADIAAELTRRGHASASVTSAHALTDAQRKTVSAMVRDTTGAETVELIEHVDASYIGGIRLSLPGRELDASIASRIGQLQFS